jgi:hypothetical protein
MQSLSFPLSELDALCDSTPQSVFDTMIRCTHMYDLLHRSVRLADLALALERARYFVPPLRRSASERARAVFCKFYDELRAMRVDERVALCMMCSAAGFEQASRISSRDSFVQMMGDFFAMSRMAAEVDLDREHSAEEISSHPMMPTWLSMARRIVMQTMFGGGQMGAALANHARSLKRKRFHSDGRLEGSSDESDRTGASSDCGSHFSASVSKERDEP